MIATKVNGKIYDGVFTSKGDEWKKRRSVLTPAFSANKMKMVSLVVILIYLKLGFKSSLQCFDVHLAGREYMRMCIKFSLFVCVCECAC